MTGIQRDDIVQTFATYSSDQPFDGARGELNVEFQREFVCNSLFAPGGVFGRHPGIRCLIPKEIWVAQQVSTSNARSGGRRFDASRSEWPASRLLMRYASRRSGPGLPRASCLRRNRFSAASAVRFRNRAAQQPRESICTANVSFKSRSNPLSTSKWSHSYFIDFAGLIRFLRTTVRG